MNHPAARASQEKQLEQLVRSGLIRELFRRGQISQSQFEALMKLQRA